MYPIKEEILGRVSYVSGIPCVTKVMTCINSGVSFQGICYEDMTKTIMQNALTSLGGVPEFIRFDYPFLLPIYLGATRLDVWLRCGKLVRSLRGKRLPPNLPNILVTFTYSNINTFVHFRGVCLWRNVSPIPRSRTSQPYYGPCFPTP